MPTLVVTKELACNFSCPLLMNVYYFGENFSTPWGLPTPCVDNASNFHSDFSDSLACYLTFIDSGDWLSVHVFCFLLHIHKVVHRPTWELCSAISVLFWKIKGLAQGQSASSSWGRREQHCSYNLFSDFLLHCRIKQITSSFILSRGSVVYVFVQYMYLVW